MDSNSLNLDMKIELDVDELVRSFHTISIHLLVLGFLLFFGVSVL